VKYYAINVLQKSQLEYLSVWAAVVPERVKDETLVKANNYAMILRHRGRTAVVTIAEITHMVEPPKPPVQTIVPLELP